MDNIRATEIDNSPVHLRAHYYNEIYFPVRNRCVSPTNRDGNYEAEIYKNDYWNLLGEHT